MAEFLVVFDTHVFLGAITKSDQDSERAQNRLIEKDRLLMSNRIIKQYQSIVYKYGQNAKFLLIALQNLEAIRKIKMVGENTIKPLNIKGLERNDQPFVELACNKAKFLVTNDPGLHAKCRECLQECNVCIKFPADYAESR